MSFNVEDVEVVVCGGGPVGLLTAYGLQRLGISTCVIERDEKQNMPMYGRASSLYPRSLELLDQLDLLHEMLQQAYISRMSITHKDGQRVTTRGWHSLWYEMQNTFYDFILNLRMKHSEDIFREAYLRLGGYEAAGWEVIHISSEGTDDAPVLVEAKQVSSGQSHVVKGKYIIGADGGKSIIRKMAKIDMPVTGSPYRWVRIDGVVETNMPDSSMGTAAIESPTHGNVLWVKLDHGSTRIGFSLNPKLLEKYGEGMTQAEAVHEAQQAMLPYTCDFKTVDWYTCYSIRQAIADTFWKDRIFLVGDAAHVHSSGAAQGMNTGIHDSTNLAWKLAGILKGHYKPEVLETYTQERRTSALKLIELDKKISTLLSGNVPVEFIDSTGEKMIDPNELLANVIQESIQFNIGLGISYSGNVLHRASKATMLTPGKRAPDHLLHGPGSKVPVRLQTLTPNTGKFNILVFAGEPLQTRDSILALRGHLDKSPSSIIKNYPESLFRFVTIVVGNRAEGQLSLGCQRFGDLYFDWDSGCHYAYGITPDTGAIAVIRPDGVTGFATTLLDGDGLDAYFASFLVHKSAVIVNGNAH